jgi:hypothetical protein
MRVPFGRRGRLLALAGFVALLAAGAVAYADIPDSGVINGCYLKSTGSLRVIDKDTTNCRVSETAISWNQLGPTGPSGPTGASGPSGPTGPSGATGPSDAYEATAAVPVPVDFFFTTLTSLDLAAGNYSISAALEVEDTAQGAIFFCRLHVPANDFADEGANTSAAHARSAIALVGDIALAAAGTVTLDCKSSNGSSVGSTSFASGQMVALAVGALH